MHIGDHNKTLTDLQVCQARLRTADEGRDKVNTKSKKIEQEMKSLSEQLIHAQHELQQSK